MSDELAKFGLAFLCVGMPAIVLLCAWAFDGGDDGSTDADQVRRDMIRVQEGRRAVQEFEGDPDGWDDYQKNRDRTWIG
jgi:hypothetical protein